MTYSTLQDLEILTRAPQAETNARMLSLNAVKGHDFVTKPYRVPWSDCGPCDGECPLTLLVNTHVKPLTFL